MNNMYQDLLERASDPATSAAELTRLADGSDSSVVLQVCLNPQAPREALVAALKHHSELRHVVARHANASPDLKGELPIGTHSDLSLALFLEEHEADEEARRFVAKAFARSPRPGGPLLQDVWKQATSAR